MALGHFSSLHEALSWSMVLVGTAAMSTELLGVTAPYGRYTRDGWGPKLGAKAAWLLQECPSFLVTAAMVSAGGVGSYFSNPFSPRTAITMAFLTHYFYRCCVYPLLIRGGKPTPVAVMLMAFSFCCWNAYLQGTLLVHQLPVSSAWQPHHYIGLSMWLVGWLLVVQSDGILRRLRKPGETGYRIPYGGLFSLVSAANYTAEIWEWTGYAVATWSLPGAAFAWFTVCNLLPRGLAHHHWYKQKMEGYPASRKAVIPFLL